MKKSLYNIQQDYLKVVEEIIDQEGEVTEEQEVSLGICKDELQVKATNYALIILDMKSKIQSIKNELERLNKLKNSFQKVEEKLEEHLLDAMDHFNIKKIESDLVKISLRQSEYVEIENVVSLPEECFTFIPEEIVPNKKKIKELIESGYPLQGASILKRNNLQIK